MQRDQLRPSSPQHRRVWRRAKLRTRGGPPNTPGDKGRSCQKRRAIAPPTGRGTTCGGTGTAPGPTPPTRMCRRARCRRGDCRCQRRWWLTGGSRPWTARTCSRRICAAWRASLVLRGRREVVGRPPWSAGGWMAWMKLWMADAAKERFKIVGWQIVVAGGGNHDVFGDGTGHVMVAWLFQSVCVAFVIQRLGKPMQS